MPVMVHTLPVVGDVRVTVYPLGAKPLVGPAVTLIDTLVEVTPEVLTLPLAGAVSEPAPTWIAGLLLVAVKLASARPGTAMAVAAIV
jgi:hypothetical protein